MHDILNHFDVCKPLDVGYVVKALEKPTAPTAKALRTNDITVAQNTRLSDKHSTTLAIMPASTGHTALEVVVLYIASKHKTWTRTHAYVSEVFHVR